MLDERAGSAVRARSPTFVACAVSAAVIALGAGVQPAEVALGGWYVLGASLARAGAVGRVLRLRRRPAAGVLCVISCWLDHTKPTQENPTRLR